MPIEIFISYSHLDEQEKNELLLHLNVLHHEGRFDLWSDDRIGVGDVWKTQIEEALIRARVAILLVTKNFLNSDFILEQEVPEILKRQEEGLTIIPVIARECAWRGVEWLARLQVFSDGEPIWRKGGRHVDKELSELAYLVADIANREQPARASAGVQPATNAPLSNPTVAEPAYEHVLYISSAPNDNQRSSSPSSQVYTTVEEELRARGSDDAPLAGHKREDGFIVSASGDPAPLLRFAMRLTEASGPAGGSRMRMGLHSIAADDAPPNRQTGLRDRAVFVARRVMELGRAGHLLVSQAAAELLRKDAEFASVFHLGRAVIEPPEHVEVYNVYRRGGPAGGLPDFGNERTPHAAVPETVVKEFHPPTELRALKEVRFKVTFQPGRAYVKLRFEFEDADSNPAAGVRIDCHKHWEQGCSFEYRFADPEQEHQPKFKLMAEDPPADQTLFIKMSCFNEYDEPLTVPLRRRVRLLRKAPFPSGASNVFQILPWSWDRLRRMPLPLQLVIILAALLAVGAYGYTRLPAETKADLARSYEALKRKHWYDYETYTAVWKDGFDITDDPPQHWLYDPGQVRVVNGTGGGETDGALVVQDGTRMILPHDSDLGDKGFYDYKAEFKLKFVEGTRASWVFRAQRDRVSGYVFTLEEHGRNLLLTGKKYVDGERFDLGSRQLDVGGTCCFPHDYFEVTADIKDYTFSHSIKLTNDDDEEAFKKRATNEFVINDIAPFVDDVSGRRFRAGNAGLVKPEGSKMEVEAWKVTPEPLP